jgi:ubiquinol-cytochrome c reductase iron-sulfur subunit
MSEIGAMAANPETHVQPLNEVDDSRRKFLTFATATTAGVGAVLAVVPFVESWLPSERARALGAPVEVDLSKVEVGQLITPVWRQQVIYVVRRPLDMVEKLKQNDDQLKDPDSKESDQPAYARNGMRSRTAEYLVMIGFCTHLGCLPKPFLEPGALGPTWPGGFRCPCHGSRYDLAGRVFNDGSPAPYNLAVPPYSYRNPTTLVVGSENGSAEGAG